MVKSVWMQRLRGHLGGLTAFFHLVAGSGGRLVLSLAYFVCVANGLSVGDFGLFATASATGVVLSRIASFGFVSPLYRVATVRRRLIGVYTVGFLVALIVSLPVVAIAACGFYVAFFAGEMSPVAFAAVMVAEVIFWRTLEVVVIVNNGLGRFGRGAIIVIIGSALRALAAVLFAAFSDHSLTSWALAYMAANAVSLGLAAGFFYPRVRLRLRTDLYLARWRDAIAVAGAEILFYVQSELDKLLVLSLGGPEIAGIYAIVMRLVDLTALPIRSFNTMIVQRLMRSPKLLASWRTRGLLEAGIAGVSIAGLAFLGGFLHVFPTALGRNVADAAPLILMALLVPAFRNVVEYQSELLYATGKTTLRALILALVGATKAALLSLLLIGTEGHSTTWILDLNAVFLILWLVSAGATYTALDFVPGSRRIAASHGSLTPVPQPGE